jgi:hypothetical protein
VVRRGGEEDDVRACAIIKGREEEVKLASDPAIDWVGQGGMLTGIVSTGSASSTISPATRDTGFDGDPVPDLKPGDTFTDGDDLSGGFVARTAFVGDDHGGSDLTVLP